ncbi:MAG: hypothetical protein HY276_09200 [Ignavibacteriales bacterium]|nr:hypothetical protein [Ignavibacteriales bacterium]
MATRVQSKESLPEEENVETPSTSTESKDKTRFAMEIPGGKMEINIHPLRKVFVLGRGARYLVQGGTVVLAPRERASLDRDRFPEIYLDGELVSQGDYRGEERCTVFEFTHDVGYFVVRVTRFLPGISMSHNDLSSALFMYYLRIENPLKLRERRPGLDEIIVLQNGAGPFSSFKRLFGNGKVHSTGQLEKEQQELQESLCYFIQPIVAATLEEDIQLWSAPRVGEVAGTISSRVDDKLKDWGLRLRKAVIAERKYPERLNELALEFRQAEQQIADMDRTNRNAWLERVGLKERDWVEMQNYSEKRGTGAGLLIGAKKCRRYIEPFLQWLMTKEEPAFTAEHFLREIYRERATTKRAGKKVKHEARYLHMEIELAEQVLFAAIRNPVLGLGEWADTEQTTAELSEYRQLEAYLASLEKPQ